MKRVRTRRAADSLVCLVFHLGPPPGVELEPGESYETLSWCADAPIDAATWKAIAAELPTARIVRGDLVVREVQS